MAGDKKKAWRPSWCFMEETEEVAWFGEKFGEKCINGEWFGV